MHVNRGLQDLAGQVPRGAAELTQQLGRSPSVAELAERIGHPQERVLEALDCIRARSTHSLQAPTAEDQTLGHSLGADEARFADIELRRL